MEKEVFLSLYSMCNILFVQTMKNYLIIFSLLIGINLGLKAQFLNEQKGSYQCSQAKMAKPVLKSKGLKSANSPSHSFDVQNYTMNIDLQGCFVSPYPNSFSSNLIISFKVDSTLNSIKLNAVNSSLIIDSVKLNALSFTHDMDYLLITLDRIYNPGEEAQVQIYYRHKDVQDYAFYSSGGFAFTDCEPEGARKWFPCWDQPSDKATTEITIKVPLNTRMASNGRLQDSTITASSIDYHWISRDPVSTYLIVLTGKNNYKLNIVNWNNPNTGEIVPFRFYFNNGENISYIKSIIGNVCSYFSENYGDHPFEKNGFATLNNEFSWGGMENQTLTSLCGNCWGESLIVHEFAHQWFGDMVTCAKWSDIWLNEGFATWSEAFWTEKNSGHLEYMNELNNNADYYLNNNPGWAISEPDWAINTPNANTLFNYAITYQKGSCVLHMLRYAMTDTAFFPALKAYATDTVNFKYKSATINDFKDKMEAESNQELDWFFDSWIFTPNHPVYKNVYNFENAGNGNWMVNFIAKQLSGLNYWQMPLELKIVFSDNSDTLVRVFNSFNAQHFIFPFNKQPVSLTFDPQNNILLKQGTTVVGINEPISENSGFGIKAAPSPFEYKTQISYNTVLSEKIKVDLYNAFGGKLINLFDGFQHSGYHQLSIDGSNLSSGIYFVVIHSGNKTDSLKIIKK